MLTLNKLARLWFSSLIFLLFMGLPLQAATEQKKQLYHDFNSGFQKAKRHVSRGEFQKANALFEELLKLHPGEWNVYDAYGQALQFEGDFDGTIKVYRQALVHSHEFGPGRKEEILRLIRIAEKKKDFAKAMAGASPWKEAVVFGSQEFAVVTNLPKEYRTPLFDKISELIPKEKKALAEIFGKKDGASSYLKIFVFVRPEEYRDFIMKRFSERRDYSPVYSPIQYHEDEKRIIIYFYGGWDWLNLAREMVRHFLRELYIQHPSRFLDDGLAEYLSLKLEKESAEQIARQNLEFINWLYDQGKLEHAMDVFSHWKSFEQALSIKRWEEELNLFLPMVWSLTYFFLEGNDPFFQDFFKRYLKYEQENGFSLTYDMARQFFEKHLSADQTRDLDNKWGRFTLGLTYEKM